MDFYIFFNLCALLGAFGLTMATALEMARAGRPVRRLGVVMLALLLPISALSATAVATKMDNSEPPTNRAGSATASPTPPPPDGPHSLGFALKFLSLSTHQNAVCNDGTPAAYYIKKGDPKLWVVHQQGGWWCWDEFSCQVRWDHFANHTTEKRTLMSTADLQALTDQYDTFNGEKNTGIMTEDPSNPLASATKVFVVYCSSDAHAGNRSAGALPTAGSTKWHFRGKEIITAVIADLVASAGLSEVRQFVLTGGSAGGMATINNADYVHGLVAGVAPSVQYIAMPDSGYFLDVAPGAMCTLPDVYECLCAAGADPSMGAVGGWTQPGGHSWLGRGQTLAQQAQAMAVLSQGVVDASCAAHYGKYGLWRCYLGQYAAPYIEVTSLFLQNQIDEWQGFWNGFFNYSHDPLAYEYAAWFRATTQGTMREAIAGASAQKLHIFSPNCYHHGLSYDNIFWQVRVKNTTAASFLQRLLDGVPTEALVLDECEGLPCTTETVGHQDCLTVPPPVL